MDDAPSHPLPTGRFATTHWSLVLAAGRSASPAAHEALAALCEVYWYPVYAFLRRKGREAEDARDLTQGLFARLIEKDLLAAADPGRGRFRSYLLKSAQNFVSNQDEHAAALKRGGGVARGSLDIERAEALYRVEPAHEMTAERIFERRWAMTLLERVLVRLRQRRSRGKRAAAFERLKVFLGGPLPSDSYAAAAGELQMSEANVKVAVHRMRAAYRDLLREEIGRTVESSGEIEDEINHLFAALGR